MQRRRILRHVCHLERKALVTRIGPGGLSFCIWRAMEIELGQTSRVSRIPAVWAVQASLIGFQPR